MINVLVLAAGEQGADEDYPVLLKEYNGRPLIEILVDRCARIGDARVLLAASREQISNFSLENIIKLIAPGAEVVQVLTPTKGAACTALLAAHYIDSRDELLIINGNELVDVDFACVIQSFRDSQADAGVVVFDSIHPRYSYLRLDSNGLVLEAAEKRPISRDATAGFYWFREGAQFVEATKNMIRKQAAVNNLFYICPSLNEMVLKHQRIVTHKIASSLYHPLKNQQQLNRFDTWLERSGG